MAKDSNVIYAVVAGPVVIGAAYGISSWLLADGSTAAADDSAMSLAFGLLLWVGAPIALLAVLPLLGGILKVISKS